MLQAAVTTREVKVILHFTRIQNLNTILNEGLMPRNILEQRIPPPDFNDQYRFDDQENAVCCSIGHPNYKMFYGLRQDNPNVEWVVLAMPPKVLWEKDCAFCKENAASANVTDIPIEDRKGVNAFHAMYENFNGKPNRTALGIPNEFPTNPQAEVLVFDVIEPRYIIGAYCQTKTRSAELREYYTDFQFACKSSPFSYRTDWGHW